LEKPLKLQRIATAKPNEKKNTLLGKKKGEWAEQEKKQRQKPG